MGNVAVKAAGWVEVACKVTVAAGSSIVDVTVSVGAGLGVGGGGAEPT